MGNSSSQERTQRDTTWETVHDKNERSATLHPHVCVSFVYLLKVSVLGTATTSNVSVLGTVTTSNVSDLGTVTTSPKVYDMFTIYVKCGPIREL